MTYLPSPERALCGKLPKNPPRKPLAPRFSMHPAPSADNTLTAQQPTRGPGVVESPPIGYPHHCCREIGDVRV
jgi:hypothetical protein